jgi:hypothetical protein
MHITKYGARLSPINEKGPIASCFLSTIISVFPTMSSNPSPSPSHSLTPIGDDLTDRVMRVRLVEMQVKYSPPPTPLEDPPPPKGRQNVAFSSQPLEFSNPAQVFQGGSLSQAHSSSRVSLDDVTPHTVDPHDVPLRVKPVGKWSLSGNAELSVFDILNIFHQQWFLSIDFLKTQVFSAQKAEDGKISWVEFTPQFHTHLVKCTVALVPHPIQKVKRMMFIYLLELFNGKGHQAFFNLTKGRLLALLPPSSSQFCYVSYTYSLLLPP